MSNENHLFNMVLPDELYEKAKKEAERLGLPLSGLIRMLIVNHLQIQNSK